MAQDTVDLAALITWLDSFRGYVTENRAYLTELDSAIGDADHGINMTRGMDAVFAKITEAQDSGTPFVTIDDLFKAVGMTMVTSVGGASGPLYGTFFLRMGRTAGTAETLDAAGLGAALRAGLDGVVARGKAEAGDKTMFDAMSPALDAYDAAVAGGSGPAAAAQAAFAAAEAGRDATVPLVARKGRASYLGERSAGHLDPGATSTALLFRALAETLAAR
jgi:dihydroxyacetone kinase-like protein